MVREAGAALRLTSRVRYEQWACSSLDNARLLRETRAVQWSVRVPRAPIERVVVAAALEDIVDFPDSVERMSPEAGKPGAPERRRPGLSVRGARPCCCGSANPQSLD